jgi:hypothetical protein
VTTGRLPGQGGYYPSSRMSGRDPGAAAIDHPRRDHPRTHGGESPSKCRSYLTNPSVLQNREADEQSRKHKRDGQSPAGKSFAWVELADHRIAGFPGSSHRTAGPWLAIRQQKSNAQNTDSTDITDSHGLAVSAGEKGGHFRRNRWVPVLKGPSAGTR